MNERILERTLTDAGARLRADAPDEVATRQALRTVRERPPAVSKPRRPVWPTLVGAGMVAAAMIGVIAYSAGNTSDTIQEVPSEQPDAPSPTPAPTPDDVTTDDGSDNASPDASAPAVAEGQLDGCVEITFPSGAMSAGCTFDLDTGHTYLTAADEVVYALTEQPTPDGTPREIGFEELAVDDSRLCSLTAEDVTGRIVGVASCEQGTNGTPVALAVRLPTPDQLNGEYFSTPHVYTPNGVRYGPELARDDDLGIIVLAGEAETEYGAFRCFDVLSGATGEWRQVCGHETKYPSQPAYLTVLDDKVVQIDATEIDGVAITELETAPPSTGCTLTDARELMTLALEGSSSSLLFHGLRCGETEASAAVSGVLGRPGPPDGAIQQYERTADGWRYLGGGTGIDEFLPYWVPTYATWSAWPGDTEPRIATGIDWTELDQPAPAATIEEFANRVVGLLDGAFGGDPEFPADVRIVSTGLAGPVIVQVDTGGDDAVRGLVYYVHYATPGPSDQDPIGVPFEVAYATSICERGVAVGEPWFCI